MNLNNIFKIFKKELKRNLREKRGNIMMILFPIVLIVILGMALSSMFGTDIELDDVKVLYTNQAGRELSGGFESFMDQAEKMGMQFEKTDDVQAGIDSIKQAGYSCYVLLEDDPQEIRLFKNERYNFEANLVETILHTFVGKYNVISAIAEENPSMLGKAMEQPEMSFLDIKSLDGERQPSSTDYYSITMLTMILLYSSETGYWSVKDEQNLKTGNRVLCSPVNKHEILTGKVMGCIIITIIQAFLVLVFSKFVLNAYWGTNIWPIAAVIISEAIMAVSFGTGVAFSIRNEAASSGMLNSVIPMVIFLGGGYVPLNVFGGILFKLSAISPVRWINQAIFRAVYSSDYSLVPVIVVMNLVIAAAFIMVSSLAYRKEAVR